METLCGEKAASEHAESEMVAAPMTATGEDCHA
jgi:hypothetical protein